MERKFNCDFLFREDKIKGVLTEKDLKSLGWDPNFLVATRLAKEIKPKPEPVSKFYAVNYNDEVGYIVSLDKLKANPHKEGSENWHRFNNDIDPVIADSITKRTDEKRFSVNDIREFIRESEHFNGSPFALALEKEIIENALCELV